MFSKLTFRRTPHLSAERQKLYKELFAHNKSVPHGFPHRPSALAFDQKLGLLAIGTKNGLLRVYGQPGVEFSAELENKVEIKLVRFVPGRAQLVTLLDDATIQLWEINDPPAADAGSGGILEKVRESDYFVKEQADRTPKQLTTLTVHTERSLILVGTQGGNIYALDLDTLELSDQVIYQDVVLQNVPDEYKKSPPGEVEVILPQPNQADKYLIGYNHGLLALWDNKALSSEHFYDSKKTLESVSWIDEHYFVTSHNDGSFITWAVTDNLTPAESNKKVPYGPFPCKAITKMVSKSLAGGASLLVFAGGMPRATYSDKYTVTLIQAVGETYQKHHTLDFTSRIVDFVIIGDAKNIPSALVVIAEEEVVAVDLTHPNWLEFKLPYLSSVHSSTITCVQHYSDVSDEVWNAISEAGRQQREAKYSSTSWPIGGGQLGGESFEKAKDLLITGHEDGSVRFWDSSRVNLSHIYSLNTAKLFTGEDFPPIDGDAEPEPAEGEDVEAEWPPFRKVGTFDPFSDDPRLAIRRIYLCHLSGTLVVAGTAGQVVVFKNGEAIEKLPVEKLDVVGEMEGFVWKGHDQLHLRHGASKPEPGYQASALIQITPPAAVTALSVHTEWQLIAVGTAHGFGLYDILQAKVVFSKSLLNPTDIQLSTAGGDGSLITRRKSLKQSLRESFRRLRAARTSKRKSASSSPSSSPAKAGEQHDGAGASKASSPIETRPVERQVESRSSDDALSSVVRCLYLNQAVLTNGEPARPTLWCGTNSGLVLVHAIALPEEEKRTGEESEAVTCTLAKELKLKHGAPALFIQVVDSTGYPIPGPLEVKLGRAKAPSTVGNSRVLIASEEQFKLFALPTLRAVTKHKLTAQEGCRVRKVVVSEFVSKDDDKVREYALLYMTNQGEVSVNALTDLKRIHVEADVIKRDNVHGITSAALSNQGEGFYLHSPSEFLRISLSARRSVWPNGRVEVPEGARPPKVEEVRPPIAAASVEPIADQVKEIEPANKAEKSPEKKKEKSPAKVEAKKDKIDPVPEIVEQSVPAVPVPEETLKVDDQKSDQLSTGIEEEDAAIVAAKVDDNVLQFINSLNEEPKPEASVVAAEPPAPATNGHHQQVNGFEQNGGSTDSEAKQSADSLVANDSALGLDVTIDSVKDHLANLTVSDDKNKGAKPSKIVPPSSISHAKPEINEERKEVAANQQSQADENNVTSPVEPVATGRPTTAKPAPGRNQNQNRGGGRRGKNRRGNRGK